ncbi:MAG TPA: GTP-binding protein [Chitinispirillaceae bacterium]|nr:GTP-binding protein [Chitinispirillaceae bacterium]
MNKNLREQMNIVVVGHVDHGKSTVIGRLLADTGSLPKGKLDQVRVTCERNARPFEYAFLLDALKDEQAQGITIDTARCFFKTKKRDYIIIDAPGHVEFLKNMISGAARAEAALLVIDAHEGIQENSKRHGYLISMLGIHQLIVLVNKMDLVNYDWSVFDSVTTQYRNFLDNLGVSSVSFIPLSARNGENLAKKSDAMKWYTGKTVLEHIDAFNKQDDDYAKPFRMPVQDIYKFTAAGDDRRIIAGTIESGQISIGDHVTFMPSGKKSTIVSIEGFNSPVKQTIHNGYATGFILKDELYLQRGEVMCRSDERPPYSATRFRANIFWMGRKPMVQNQKYKLKIAAARVPVRLVSIITSIDAAELTSVHGKKQIERHDVAECIFETTKPFAFCNIDDIHSLGRFVIVDGYDIAGGGIITGIDQDQTSLSNKQLQKSEIDWDTGLITEQDRQKIYGHKSRFIVITGKKSVQVAKSLEYQLFTHKKVAYYLGPVFDERDATDETTIHKLGEFARIFIDAGIIFITSLKRVDESELNLLSKLTAPFNFFHVSIENYEDMNTKDTIILNGIVEHEKLSEMIIHELKRQGDISDFSI